METPIPEPPDSARHLLCHLWGEAWKAALVVHEPERQAFARARAEHEREAKRNEELSQRVISEAAKARALGARVGELEGAKR